MSANENIRDALVDHGIDLRRVDAGTQREVGRIFNDLQKSLRALLVRNNMLDAKRQETRNKRLLEFQADSRKLIRDAYAQVATLVQDDLRRLAVVDATLTSQLVNQELSDG